MKKLLIFGTTDLARLVHFYITKYKLYEIAAFTAHTKYIRENRLFGLPVIPFETISEQYPPDKYSFALCIGYTKINEMRKQLFYEIKKAEYSIENIIFPSSRAETDNIGEGNIIFPFAAVDPLLMRNFDFIIKKNHNLG